MPTPVTEIASITLKPGAEIEGSSETAKVWKQTIETIREQEGYQRLYYGRAVEDEGLLMLFIGRFWLVFFGGEVGREGEGGRMEGEGDGERGWGEVMEMRSKSNWQMGGRQSTTYTKPELRYTPGKLYKEPSTSRTDSDA